MTHSKLLENNYEKNNSIFSEKKICWVREWPFEFNSKKTFALEITQITLQIYCSNQSPE